MRMKLVLAAMSGLFQGKVRIADRNPPASFRLVVEGTGKIGFMKGEGVLTLTSASPATMVSLRRRRPGGRHHRRRRPAPRRNHRPHAHQALLRQAERGSGCRQRAAAAWNGRSVGQPFGLSCRASARHAACGSPPRPRRRAAHARVTVAPRDIMAPEPGGASCPKPPAVSFSAPPPPPPPRASGAPTIKSTSPSSASAAAAPTTCAPIPAFPARA